MLEGLVKLATLWELRRSPGGGCGPRAGLVVRFVRCLWSYRVEWAALWLVYWFLVAVNVVMGPDRGGWFVNAVVVFVLAFGSARRRVRAVFTRSRLRRRFARAVRSTGCPGSTDAVPRPGRIRAVPAGQVMRVRLSAGWHVGDLEKRADAIAAFLGVREVRVTRDRANAGAAEVTVVRRDPLSGGKPMPWPWLGKVRTSLWDAIPVGMGEDGNPIEISMPERNIVLGGEPGGGKSAALSQLVAAAALDPYAHLTLFDGKLVELAVWRGCADHFVGPNFPQAIEVLKELRADMEDRYLY
ncbi:MAG TPA: hypothetical protein VET24_11590, partial [Actinomycetota bacterium]|nr:hypothetical protein [Actinomycetota bacterium]